MRKYFYELTFSVDDEENCLDAYIGIYLTRQRVEEVKSQLIKQPGFCLYPDLFIVKRKWVEVEDPSAFKPGFILYHLSFEYETYSAEEETYLDEIYDLGYFVKREEAEKKKLEQERRRSYQSKNDYGAIDALRLDLDIDWPEGFDKG